MLIYFKKNKLQSQNHFKKIYQNKRLIEVRDAEKTARVTPFDQTMITCNVEYPHKLIGKQSISLALTPQFYKSQICSARTFGFMKDVKIEKKGFN